MLKRQLAQAQANQIKAQNDVNRYIPLAKEQAIPQQDLDNADPGESRGHAQVRAAKASSRSSESAGGCLLSSISALPKLSRSLTGLPESPRRKLGTSWPEVLLTTVSTVDPDQNLLSRERAGILRLHKRKPRCSESATKRNNWGCKWFWRTGRFIPTRANYFGRPPGRCENRHTAFQGVFPNPGNVLRPGEYAHIRTIIATRKGALVVPQKAVSELQGNYQVAVVGSDNKVQIRPVKVGERMGTEWIIDGGIEAR